MSLAKILAPLAGSPRDAIVLANYTVNSNISAGASQQLSDSVTLPDVADGNYSLIVVDNSQGQVYERGATSNNTAVSAGTSSIDAPECSTM